MCFDRFVGFGLVLGGHYRGRHLKGDHYKTRSQLNLPSFMMVHTTVGVVPSIMDLVSATAGVAPSMMGYAPTTEGGAPCMIGVVSTYVMVVPRLKHKQPTSRQAEPKQSSSNGKSTDGH